MQHEQVTEILTFINASWANMKPLPREAAAVWGSELAKQDYEAVLAVLKDLVRTSKFRPSLAEILAPIWAPKEASAGEAFANIWDRIGRRGDVTDLEAKAVRHLGGWDVLGQWQIDERHFHYARFVEIWKDLLAEQRGEELRALAANERPALAEGE